MRATIDEGRSIAQELSVCGEKAGEMFWGESRPPHARCIQDRQL